METDFTEVSFIALNMSYMTIVALSRKVNIGFIQFRSLKMVNKMNVDADPISLEDMRSIVGDLARAKSAQDISAAMQIYHPEGVLTSPSLGSSSVGAVQIESALNAFFSLFPDYSVSIEGDAQSGMTYIAWGKIGMTPTGEVNGKPFECRRAELDVFMRFQFRNHRILKESFHFDLGQLCLQSGLPLSIFGTSSVKGSQS